jgi:hypothetical protein
MAASAAFLGAQIDPPSRVGRLNYMDGAVSFRPTGINDWIDADINRPLTTGDNIWVGDRGRAEFHIGSAALRLSAYSDFQFLNLDDQTVQIRLSEGTLTVRLRYLAQNQIFEVDTPNVAFTLDRPGEYRIDANPDSQSTIITVRDGEGEVTGGGQAFPVYTRQRVVVRGYDQINYNLASAGGTDEFDQWCSSRDRREDQSQSARYVSREIPGYDDLDQYGRWGDQPGYGQVWMPTTVAAGWAPYHDGHWAWIAPWGWTWVDEAPWGFAPYHYGRWASFGGRWGWIPGPYGVTPLYAPALVGWVGGGRGGSGFSLSFSIGTSPAVGWFPLGPREPYFPSYQVSQGYFTRVNNTNTVINNTTINNYYDYSRNSNNTAISNIQYVNRNVQNGVTAVPQNTFASGRRVTQDARAVPSAQLASVQVVAAPAIAPQRESVLGSRADTASRAARPPAEVLSRPVVARTAPPPAPVPFERQQAALSQNPGRPLPSTQVQQMRQSAPAPSAPVRVVDMGQVRRVQPAVGASPAVPAQNTVPQPPGFERQNGPPGQLRQQQQQQQQPQDIQRQQDVQRQQQQDDIRRRQQQQPQEVSRPAQQLDVPRPQPPVTERQNAPPGQLRQQQQQQDVQRQQQQQDLLRQQQQDLQRQQQQQDVRRQQQNVPQPPPPVTDRQNAPPGQQRQQQQEDIQRQQQQDLQRQQQQQDIRRQQQNVPQPPPPVTERQNAPPGQLRQQPDVQRQQQQQQDVQRQQQQEIQRQQQQEIQRQQQQQDVRRQQQTQPQPPPPAAERQNVPPGRQQPEVARPPAQQPQPPAVERQQRPDRGKQNNPPNEDDKKSNR